MNKYNCFLTLTYKTEKLPEHGNLRHRDIQLFFKKLRNLCSRLKQNSIAVSPDKIIKYYMAGEYGTINKRPHYHICLFGIDFTDKKYLRLSPAKHKLYTSPTLEKLWPHGYSSIGEVNFQTAAYTARYIISKITGKQALKHYQKINIETGEIIKITPEYNQMSRKQAIGKTWFEKFTTDIYPHGHMVIRGHKTNTPRYYDKQYSLTNPEKYDTLQYMRHIEGLHHRENQTDARLKVREQVQHAQLKQLKREL